MDMDLYTHRSNGSTIKWVSQIQTQSDRCRITHTISQDVRNVRLFRVKSTKVDIICCFCYIIRLAPIKNNPEYVFICSNYFDLRVEYVRKRHLTYTLLVPIWMILVHSTTRLMRNIFTGQISYNDSYFFFTDCIFARRNMVCTKWMTNHPIITKPVSIGINTNIFCVYTSLRNASECRWISL